MADKIRLGLIGASVRGTWSARSHLLPARASSDVELTAVRTTPARRRGALSSLPICARTGSADARAASP